MPEIEGLRDVAMATNFGTKSAITGFVWTIATRRLVMEGGVSGRPTECRYCRHPATKGRCHGNQFWDCISCKWTLTEDNDMRLSCKGWCVISHLWRWELLQTGDCQVGNWHVNANILVLSLNFHFSFLRVSWSQRPLKWCQWATNGSKIWLTGNWSFQVHLF